MQSSHSSESLHWLVKALCLVAVGVLAVLGLIGLVLPIIPGLLFLFLAGLLLSRISRRFDTYAGSHSWFRSLRKRWHRASLLSATDRLRLGFWTCAGATLRGIESLVRAVEQRLKSGSTSR